MTPTSLLPALLLATLPLTAVEEPKSCCAETPAATAPSSCCATPAPAASSCCDEVASTAFSEKSIYQLEAVFTDDSGKRVPLASLRGRPVLLAMFFSSCTFACPALVADLAQLRARLPEDRRRETAIVLVSFDVARDTPPVLQRFREQRHLDEGWTLLHGDAATVSELAALLGVKYRLEADGQFAHSNLITVLNAEGEVIHQRKGLAGGHDDVLAALAR
jgi:protein SCO1